jgi:hypothetical protein
MKRLSALMYAIACIVLISSCKKDDEPSVPRSELLAGKTSKSWKQTAGKENGSDYFSAYDDCDKDDLYVFRANKNFELNEGASKCDPDYPQIYDEGTWELKTNDTVIKILGDDSDLEASIVELTNTTLRIKYVNGGDTYEDTFTAQ